jgi:hypothetical protein
MEVPSIVMYQGSRYRAGRVDKDTIEVVSEDPADMQRGFAPYEYQSGVYVKEVRRAEVDEVYLLYTMAQFRGKTYPVVSMQDGKYQLFGHGGDAKFGFQRIDHGVWERWVGPEELDRIWEERTPI